ncbi:MAG: acetate--CoA ligase family protein [Actinobacteria bacterium]|nr:acetate--CoA ligase family protein [Actinomycetota bacterium]
MTHSLAPMLRARSVAVVGATERPGSVGSETMRQLAIGGYEGEVYPVNPGYETVAGLPAHRSLEDVNTPMDHVVLAVGNEHLEAEMEKVVATGARSVTIFASCHGTGAEGRPLRERVTDLAEKGELPICGGNGMGFLNVETSLRVCGFYQPPGLLPGGITFLSHSGSMFSAMLHNRRDLRFNLVVSTGLELNTTMDRYLDWALDLESTRAVALFIETVRDPAAFRASLARAEKIGIPVVALKVGTSGRARQAVITHSGALAGEEAVYDALFEAHGVHRVRTMDEMADTLELLTRGGRRATAPGLAALGDSGGERVLLIDTAEKVGVPLPEVGVATRHRLGVVLDPGLDPENPVDAWGTGREATAVFVEVIRALADDPGMGAVAFVVDLTTEEKLEDAYSAAAIEAASATTKPVMVIANLSTTVDPLQARTLREGGIPVLEGTETALRAVRHLLDRHHRSTRPEPEPRLSEPGRPVGDVWSLLDAYGIANARPHLAHTEEEAVRLGKTIGYPLVMKTTAAAHKTEVSGVKVGIGAEPELRSVFWEMTERLGPPVAIAPQVPAGVEMAVGVVDDPQFGPAVVVSAGGTLIELLADRVVLLPPLDRHRVRAAVDRLRVRPLLDGYRGEPPADVDRLVDLVVRISELAIDNRDVLGSLDLNPVICGPDGAVAVDALMVRS